MILNNSLSLNSPVIVIEYSPLGFEYTFCNNSFSKNNETSISPNISSVSLLETMPAIFKGCCTI